ncbi:ty3-gypsy retrotransposon protein [Tanacetum coccineum]
MPPRKDTSNDDQPTSFQDQLSALNAKVDALETFTRALELRFGPSSFKNHQAALFKLKQTSSVAAFQTEFEGLSNCVVGLPTTTLINCFISGLCSDIQQEITVYKPTTLHQTYGLSKLIEDKLAANESQVASSSRPPFIFHTTQTTTIKPTVIPPAILPKLAKQTTSLPTRRLSPEEMQTRRSQGLCFRCPERFYPGHRCNPPQFLLLGNDEPLPLTSNIEAQTNLEDHSYDTQPLQFLALSTAALHDTTCPLAIRITGYINGHTVTVLVDSGSSHNIIKPCLVSLLHLPFDSQPSFPIMIGNGADVVLGMSWLSALGPVKADFSVWNGNHNCVVGLRIHPPSITVLYRDRSDIQQEITVYKPTTLHQTYGLSKLIEDKLAANESQVASSSRPPFIFHTTQTTTIQPTLTPLAILSNPAKQTTPLPTQRLSPEEMQTRRSQGLCFCCPERFYPGHRCNPPQFLLLGNDEPLPLTSDTEAQTDLEEYSGDIQPHRFLALSAAALHGTTCPLAILITGHVNGHTVTVLVDSGSSHNIIKPCLVSLLHLPFDSQPLFPFMIGNGTFLHCTGQCPNIDLRLSNTPFSISPYVFPIEGADVVLGMSWLSALGPVKADFSVPQLTFNHLDKQVTLRGESSPKSGIITTLRTRS